MGGGEDRKRQLIRESCCTLSILSATCYPRSGEQAKSKDPYALRGILGRLKVFSHDRVLLTSERAVRIPLRSIHWLRSQGSFDSADAFASMHQLRSG